MKKTLLALAALLAGHAMAQQVTLFGLVDMGLVRESGGAAGAVTKLTSGVLAGSRWGVRGYEDLGDGLTAGFMLEAGLLADTGAAAQNGLAFGRQAFVSLNGRYGSLKLGRQYKPIFFAIGDADPFAAQLAGQAGNLMAVSAVRMNDAVGWTSPNLNGFGTTLMVGLGEQPSARDGRQLGGTFGYDKGPLMVKASFNDAWTVPVAAAGATAAVPSLHHRNSVYLAKYDFGPAAVSAAYGINKSDRNTNAQNGDSRDALLGVRVPLGVHTVMASVVRKDDRTALNRDATQWALGYTYDLSKRTALYVAYARIRNNAPNTATQGFYTVGNPTEAGTGDRAFNLGIRHAF